MNNNKNSEISERILQIIEYVKVTPNKFSKNLGYDRTQTIYDILNCKSAPSFDFFQRLFNSEYSELINPIWLFTGKGNMKPETKETINFVHDSEVEYGCKSCMMKDEIIEALRDSNLLLKEKISNIEKPVRGKKSDYSKTA